MDGDFGGDVITITDDDGNEFELELLDTLEYQDETYSAFATTESAADDEVEVVIFKVVEEDGEEVFERIDDEALLEEVYELFMERLEDDDEDDSEDDEK